MAGVIFEAEQIEEKYKTITDKEIDTIINELKVKSLSLNHRRKYNESQIITGIITSLNKLKELKEEYQRLRMKEQKTDFDLQHLEELDNKIEQIWLLYLKNK
jgi:paraquat-inducible protein B